MEKNTAFAQIKRLGEISAAELERRGYGKVEGSLLVHGLAAYTKLNLVGEDASLDKAYDIVFKDMMDAVRGSWKAA